MLSVEDLHGLIHSLSQAEKRYVKVFASKHVIGEKNNYLVLFDEILKQKEYDEPALKKKLKNQNFIKHLSSEKNYLYQMILKSMRSFHAEQTVDIQLKEMIQDIRFLYEKRLYEQSMKLLIKARKRAEEFDRFAALLELDGIAITILTDKNVESNYLDLPEIKNEIHAVLGKQGRYWELYTLKTELVQLLNHNFYTSKEQAISKARELMGKIQEPELPEEDTFINGYLYYSCMAAFYQIILEYDKAADFYRKLIAWWDKHAYRLEIDAGEYKKTLSNYLNLCHVMQRFDEFEAILSKINALPNRTEDEIVSHFKNVYFLELLFYLNSGKFEQAEQLIPQIEKGLEKFEGNINSSREITFFYNIFWVYFFRGKPKEANHWVQKIMQYKKTEVRQDIQDTVSVLQLLLFYEMANYDLIEYRLRAVQRFLHNHGRTTPFFRTLLSFLRQLTNEMPGTEESYTVLKQMRNELMKIRKEAGEKNILGHSETIIWIDSKLHKKSLEETASMV